MFLPKYGDRGFQHIMRTLPHPGGHQQRNLRLGIESIWAAGSRQGAAVFESGVNHLTGAGDNRRRGGWTISFRGAYRGRQSIHVGLGRPRSTGPR